MTFIDWFAGIGGFRLGLERAGMQCVGSCEIERAPRKIYEQRFGEQPTWADIRDIDPEVCAEFWSPPAIPPADLWCGGFPCQGLSVAGKRGGLDDPRSGLFWQWFSLVEKRRPRWLLIENVPGFLSCSKGADLGLALASLDFLGYGISRRILDAQYFGVPQRRRRVYIVGHLGAPCPPEILFEPESREGNPPPRGKTGTDVAHSLDGCTGGPSGKENQQTFVSHALTGRGYKGGDPNTDEYVVAALVGQAADTDRMRESAGIPGRMDMHVPGTALGGCACADSPRYRALGNAVAVPVIKWIGERIVKAERLEKDGFR